jgi:hypothetical protein
MKQKKISAPRNPYVAAAHMRKAGPHQKTNKAIRRKETVKLMRDSH